MTLSQRRPPTLTLDARATPRAVEVASDRSGSGQVIGDSLAGSLWTAVSRLTGLARAVTIGAVLGATYLGNAYQAINSLPNLVYYQLLAGSLFASILVPVLVRHVDSGDQRRAQGIVSGFLGTVLPVAFGASVLMLLAGRVLLRLMTLGVSNAHVAAAERRVGWALLIMFAPQITLYLVAGTGMAVMNACGRFALAAGAPAVENIGIIVLLATTALVFGSDTDITHVSHTHVLLLGLGTTAAVAAHAGCQWLGARAAGIRMTTTVGWRDPEVRMVLRRMVATLAYTGLAALQIVAVLVVANRLAGGVVAFQLALNFLYLPLAIVAWPIGRALLPQLARLRDDPNPRLFADELARGVGFATFIMVPISVAYLTLAFPLARAIAFGNLGTGHGVRLIALSLAALGVGLVAETWFILGTYGFYAREDVRSPVVSMSVRALTSLCCMVPCFLIRGPYVLPMLGLALSLGSIAGAGHMAVRLRARKSRGRGYIVSSVRRALLASAAMAPAALLVTVAVRHVSHTHVADVAGALLAALAGITTYLAAHAAQKSPELAVLNAEVARVRASGRGE